MSTVAQKSVIVGIDIGSWTFKISVFKNKIFDVLTNEANFRQTPSLVAFTNMQRLVGQQAQNKIKSNFVNTIRAPLRLIGLERSFDLVEQQLRYTTNKYDVVDQLNFTIQIDQNRSTKIQPEHLLLSLLSKVHRIVQSHGLVPQSYYLTIPSYMSHYQRKIVKRCGEIVLHSPSIHLIDDWTSIASQYVYTKINELKNCEPRIVMFLDIGYSKSSFFVLQFSKKSIRLLDCQHLRFIGSKNMDHLLAQFYDQGLKNKRNTSESLFSIHKSLIKIVQHIQKQRKVLSANQDCHLNVESLVDDYDLSYNMKRQQFQKINQSVFSQIKKSLNKLKERMPENIKLYSIELIGGASRIPFIKSIVQDVFKIQASRTMNQTETMARGAVIYGAISRRLITLDYLISDMNLVDICVCWNATLFKNQFFGQNQSQYSKKEIVFKANGRIPNENVLSFGNQGLVELYIYYGHTTSTKSIGYLRFNTPNRLRFILTSNKIVEVKLDWGDFVICKMQDKKQTKWNDLIKWQTDLRTNEERIRYIQELKNQYQAKFYKIRNRMEQIKEFMNSQQHQSFFKQFNAIQQFIQSQNTRILGTPEDVGLYQEHLREIEQYNAPLQVLEQRKINSSRLIQKFQTLKTKLDKVKYQTLNFVQQRKFTLLVDWIKDSYLKMKESNWEGYYLTDSSLDFAIDQLNRILKL